MMQQQLFDSGRPYVSLSATTSPQLYVRDGSGALVPAQVAHILAAARAIAEEALPSRRHLDAPALVKQFFSLKLHRALEHEVFGIALLDCRYCLIEYQEPFRGTIDQAAVYPREIVKLVLQYNAAAVIIGHNHPSGSLEPSLADRVLTNRIREALSLIDVRLLDHILVAGNRALSFAEAGHL